MNQSSVKIEPITRTPQVLTVLRALGTLSAKGLLYGSALLAMAAIPGAELTGPLAVIAAGLGVEALGGLLDRLANGEPVSEEQIRQTVEEAIVQSDIAGALEQQETQAMVGLLFDRMDLMHYLLASGQSKIVERLSEQAAQYETLLAKFQATAVRIDETNARIEKSTGRIQETTARTYETVVDFHTRLEALLGQTQPPTDPAQQLTNALALLTSLPLEEIPAIRPLPPGSRLPFSPNPLFVGRENELLTLARILQKGGTAAVGQVAAATGLGGIGKTQLAVEFAHRYGRFFAGGVFWLSCSNPDAVPAEVVECGKRMGLPGFEALDFPNRVDRVEQAWQEPIPRLLIFDNCEKEEVLADWRPATGGCRMLVTSRRASWSAGLGVRSLALPVLPRAESVALLRRFREDLAEGDLVLDAIAAELGDLPLALHLARSFLSRYRFDVTPAGYLAQLRAPGLLAHRSLVMGDYSPTGHEAHVARTFALSYERLDPEDPVDGLALALLARLAYFAPGEPVPRELLLLTVHRSVDGPDYEASDALRRLVELGLVGGQKDGGLVMHRLVAAFVLGLPGAVEAQGAVEEALGELARHLNESGWPGLLLSWQGHLRHVTDRALARGDVRAALLSNRLGYHLESAGNLNHARLYWEQALILYRQILGEKHSDTATSLNNLGNLLREMGDPAAALPYLEQALAIRRQVLGEKHLDTGQSLNNLGLLLMDMGDLPAARLCLEQAIGIFHQALGRDHPTTAIGLNNMGMLMMTMGDLPAARTYLEQALAIWRHALGEVHPQTATSLNNVGVLFQATGDLSAARPYLELALAIRRHALGEAHPYTTASLSNLAMLLKDMGDLLAARPYLEQALVLAHKVLGEDHPNTATGLNDLGMLLQAVGDLSAARSYYEQALAIWRQALDEAHSTPLPGSTT